jgi:cytochrome bd-type quinol oxidase subunit 1
MPIETLIAALIGLLIGAVVTFFVCKIRTDSVREQMKEKISSYERELENFRKNGLSVVTYPYKEEHGENGFFSDERRAEVGYKYQVFVAGVPCFEAHKTVIDVFSKKQVNVEKIEMAMQQAFNLIETFASKHPAFIALKAAPLPSKPV